MITLIYNKQPQSGKEPSSCLCFSPKEPALPQSGITDVRSCEHTRQIPVTPYSKDEIMPYVPIKVKRGKVKKTFREIRKEKSFRLSASMILSFAFCICVCTTLAYFAFSGIYAPKEMCKAVVEMCKSIYAVQNTTDGVSEKLFDYSSQQTANSGTTTPHYLSHTQQNQSFSGATQGEAIQIQSNTELSKDTKNNILPASSNNSFSTSGSDGEIYYPLLERDLSCNDPTLINNQTSYSPNTSSLLSQTPSAFENLTASNNPLVLILHTHATECYSQSPSDANSYLSTEPTRLDDTEKNVVRVGKELCDTLNAFGVNTLHVTTLHDKASFINAYTESKKTAQKYLEQYPSIRFVIDLHRDAITSGNQKSKTVISYGDQSYAQLMFVVGTNENGSNHPDWQSNLSLALNLQNASNAMYPGLFRKTNLRNVPFNQQISNGYMLLEVGTCGNNLDEALRSANAFGTVLAGEILKNTSST